MDVGDECRIQQRLRLRPEIPAVLFVAALGVGNKGSHQLQDILFRVEIGKGVVVHGLFEVDGVEDADFIPFPQKKPAALHHDAALWVCDNKTDGIGLGCTLHEVGLQPKSRLTAAGTANDEHVFVPCGLGVFWSVVHGQSFRLGQNDVVFKGGIDVGLNILRCAP